MYRAAKLESELGPWLPFFEESQFNYTDVIFNPSGNLRLAEWAIFENYLQSVSHHAAHSNVKIEQLIEAKIDASHKFYQFKVCEKKSTDNKSWNEDLIVSKIFSKISIEASKI